MSEPVRLHRYIAQCGVCSRRKAEELIVQGRVSVNGETVVQLGTKVTGEDEIAVDGDIVHPEKFVYLTMYKPVGIITTMDDERGRQTVAHLLPNVGATVKPVGRLDKDSEGLLLFTNDGELAKMLTHPRHSVAKDYEVVVEGFPDRETIERLRTGVVIERRTTRPADVEIVKQGSRRSTLKITLREGRKRQIRQMCEVVGHPVISLKRTRFGCLTLKGMRPGECKIIGQVLVSKLRGLAESI